MKISSIIVGFIVAIYASSFYAMEIELDQFCPKSSSINLYESLTGNVLHDIHEQQCLLSSIQIQDDIVSFSLKDMYEKFFAMPNERKYQVFKNMSQEQRFLLRVAICLPSELIKQICVSMMDGEIPSSLTQEKIALWDIQISSAAEKFYITPIDQAFDQYHSIKVWIKDGKPIGPLYIEAQNKRDSLLGIKPEWYSSVPLITKDKKKLVDELGEIKDLYLEGQALDVLPINSNDLLKDCVQKTVFLGIPPCFFGISSAVATAIGACYGNFTVCLCSQPFLVIFGGVSSVCCVCGCIGFACATKECVTNFERITI